MRLRTISLVASAIAVFGTLPTHAAVFGRLRIASAATDHSPGTFASDQACRLEPLPQVMVLKVGHVHEVSVESKAGTFSWYVSNPNVAVVDGSGRTVHVTGKGLGEAELVVSTFREGHVEKAVLTIRGISPRYTVVGWLDGGSLVPELLAPTANKNLKANLNNSIGCHYLMGRWLYWGTPTDVSTAADRLYAEAFMLNSASNPEPPSELDDDFHTHPTRFKLYNDFQVDAAGVPIQQSALIGSTPIPCGLPIKVKGEFHPDNNGVFWNEERTAVLHLNEARIGESAQRIMSVIDPQSGGVEWIWSVDAFDKIGRTGVNTQTFPSYWVYKDGVICGKRKQEELARFLKTAKSSELNEKAVRHLRVEDLEIACSDQSQ